MGARDIRAGGAYVEILAKDGALRKGLDKAGKTLKSWGDGVAGIGKHIAKIGAAALTPLAATTKVFSSMGDQLAKASARTGISVEALSELQYAADQSGSSLEGLETSLKKMDKAFIEAAKGSDSVNQTFARLGVTVEDLKNLAPEERFEMLADRISQIQDPALRSATAMEIFGKSGTELLPLMSEGAEGIQALRARARELGLTFTTSEAKAAEEYGDRLDDLWKVVKRGTAVIGSALVPILREAVVQITGYVVFASRWIKSHKEIVVTAFKVAAGTLAAGVGLFILGKALGAIGLVIGGVSKGIGLFAVLLAKVAGVLTFLFSGTGLVVAGLGALAAYLLSTSNAGQAAMSALGGYFSDLKEVAMTTFQGVKDAIAAGDWKAAVRVLWAGLKATWLTGIQPLRVAWLEFKKLFTMAAINGFANVMTAWEYMRTALTRGWISTTGFLTRLWDGFVGFITDTWDAVTSLFEKGIFFAANKAGLISDKQYQDLQQQMQSQEAQSSLAKARDEQAKSKDSLDKEEAASAAEKARFDAAMKKIEADAVAGMAGAVSNAAEDIAAATAEEKAARDELNMAALRPSNLANAFEESAGTAGWVSPDLQKIIDDIRKNFADNDEIDKLREATVSTRGTFNAAAIQSLQAGTPIERVAKATEATAKHTKKLIDKVGSLAGEFI